MVAYGKYKCGLTPIDYSETGHYSGGNNKIHQRGRCLRSSSFYVIILTILLATVVTWHLYKMQLMELCECVTFTRWQVATLTRRRSPTHRLFARQADGHCHCNGAALTLLCGAWKYIYIHQFNTRDVWWSGKMMYHCMVCVFMICHGWLLWSR